MKIEAVLFDMDGTLINSEPAWLSSEIDVMADFNYSWTVDDQAACLGGPLARVGQYMSDLANGARNWEYFRNSLVSKVEEKFHLGIDFMSGALELLQDLSRQDIPMALVSASPRSLVQAALDAMPHPFFSTSVSSDDVTYTKPHPQSYLKAAQELGVDIHNCLVLEDSLPGVQSGLDSGAWVIAIPHLVPIADHPRVRKVDDLYGYSFDALVTLFSDKLAK